MNIFLKIYYKLHLDQVCNTALSTWDRLTWKPLHIMTASQTVDYILKNHCSLARFGDGELQIAAYGCALKFQRSDSALQKHLRQVMHSANPNLLLCLPNRLNMLSPSQRNTLSPYWQKSLKQHLHAWTRHLNKNRVYGDTNVTRLTDGASDEEKKALVEHIKKIWENRNVIILEGEKTRFGVGNSLLEHALSVQRILGPAESAYDCYEKLLSVCLDTASHMTNCIILLALGPTATVLASDLADHNIQAIDLGHLDISYERLETKNEGAIPGKYTNESVGGNQVEECFDPAYRSQILCRISK